MSLSDQLLVAFIVLWLGLTVAFFLIGLQVWGWLWLAILGVVAVAELVSTRRSGRTITQRFQAWARLHRVQAAVLLLGMAAAWGLLLLHLVTH